MVNVLDQCGEVIPEMQILIWADFTKTCCAIYTKTACLFLRLKHCFEKDKKQKEKYETFQQNKAKEL